MILTKKKTFIQIATIQSLLSRLDQAESDLLKAGEPMLSSRLGGIRGNLLIALEHSKEEKG